jgi:hypothetical protein
MKTICKEKNICTRCGDSTDKLTYHSEGQFWCDDCEDMYDEFIILQEEKRLDDQNLLDSMVF